MIAAHYNKQSKTRTEIHGTAKDAMSSKKTWESKGGYITLLYWITKGEDTTCGLEIASLGCHKKSQQLAA